MAMKESLQDRADRIADTVAAYHEFKRTFAKFASLWKEKCGELAVKGVSFAGHQQDENFFDLFMFDGRTLRVEFSMILDKTGKPWGRVEYRRDESGFIGKFYFDEGGYLFNQPERRMMDGGTPNITLSSRFQEIAIGFMEQYLDSSYREK